MKKKEYRCPECGGEMPFAAIDFGRDSMRCPGCGAVSSCRLYVQRERARGELGAPPCGVRVHKAVPTVNGQSASEVVYCWRRLSVILILTSVVGWGGFGAVVMSASANWMAAIISVAITLVFAFSLFCEVFGRSRLRVAGQKAVFSTECWFYRRRVEFFLPPDSRISVKTRMKYAGAKEGDAVSEIVVERPKMPDAAFGQSLPEEAQDYFCECLARGALGTDLPNAKGRTFAGQVVHPFPFVLFLVAALVSFAFAFSKTGLIAVGFALLIPAALSCRLR